jgi:hypothetical protein
MSFNLLDEKENTFLMNLIELTPLTWTNGLKEFGDFEIITWELNLKQHFFNRVLNFRIQFALLKINKIIKLHQPDMVIAERTTSYGFLPISV